MSRILKVQKFLKDNSWDYLFLEDPTQIFYLSGMVLSSGQLIIAKDDAALFVDSRYFERASRSVPYTVKLLGEANLKKFLKKKGDLCFDSKSLTYHKYAELKKVAGNQKLLPIFSPLKEVMAQKEKEEISLIRKSCDLAFLGYRHLRSMLRSGIREEELSLGYEKFAIEHGAKLAFAPIIAFGSNSSVPHHYSGLRAFRKEDFVLMDVGVKVSGYCSDMTRSFSLKPKDKETSLLCDTVMEAYEAALEICKCGALVKDLDIAAHKVFRKRKMEKYALHRLGHGVGLLIHEYPSLNLAGMDKDVVLKENMIFTIEPGLYISGKVGVRYENTILLKKNGVEELTRFKED